ncbi:MAG: hypothetical protein BroJett029_01270 [Alphaproteobacteria bacterium]|nr:MAG: hypothetical protein BroJett029_01270 [Alphaproteobacteria bacterium]
MRLISDLAWNTALGEAAQNIGHRDFQKTLLGLFGRLIPHDMTFIARYSRFAPAELLHHDRVPSHIVGLFRERYQRLDPFHAWWREHGEPGIVTQRMTSVGARRNDRYRVFLRQAHIADEIGMFLPAIGGATLALFLERSGGVFTAAEIARARNVFPVFAGLYRAHLARLFVAMSGSPAVRPGKILPRPMMLVDRNGRRVFATRAWRDAEAAGKELAAAAERLRSAGASQVPLPDGRVLVCEAVDGDFPVAPGGRIYVIEKQAAAPSPLADPSGAAGLQDGLTRREQQIVGLILQGYPTDGIARKLGIGRGTVKNHRRRLYLKLDITSERELFVRYADALSTAAQGGFAERG